MRIMLKHPQKRTWQAKKNGKLVIGMEPLKIKTIKLVVAIIRLGGDIFRQGIKTVRSPNLKDF